MLHCRDNIVYITASFVTDMNFGALQVCVGRETGIPGHVLP